MPPLSWQLDAGLTCIPPKVSCREILMLIVLTPELDLSGRDSCKRWILPAPVTADITAPGREHWEAMLDSSMPYAARECA